MRCVLLLTVVAAATHAFDTSALIPDLEELGGSLAQILASVSSGAALSAEMQEQYRQVVLAEQIFLRMLDDIKADQAKDDQLTADTEIALATDATTLEVAIERQQSAQAHHDTVLNRLRSTVEKFKSALGSINGTLVELRSVVEQTRSECQTLADRKVARTDSLRGDLIAITKISEKAAEFNCAEIQAASTAGHFTVKAVQFTCETRKQAVNNLLDDLKTELYSAVSQDSQSLEVSAKACVTDIELQQSTIDLLSRKVESISNDIGSMEDQDETVTSEIRATSSAITASRSALDLSNRRAATTKCRHNRRAEMRDDQSQTVIAVLSMLSDLGNSPYVENHLLLTAGCANNCSDHGSCFRGVCHCDYGWMTDDCSLSVSRDCPFEKHATPCTNPACYGTDFLELPESSACAAVVCDHCRRDPSRLGCAVPAMALFCAERDRGDGCDQVTCPASRNGTTNVAPCGIKREQKAVITGCCFNPLLDCQDKCVDVHCPTEEPRCDSGFAVRYPLRDCCFDKAVDCVDQCGLAMCSTEEPSCPTGSQVRRPFAGCCFDPTTDCESDCSFVVCDENILPGDACRSKGLRWSGGAAGCCFDDNVDCVTGDDSNQASERLALTSLFQTTNGKKWKNSGNSRWGSDKWICYWDGVECSGDAGNMHVTSISLVANDLTGSIPPELEQLTGLEILDLSGNSLNGPIPDEFGSLKALHTLRLKQNGLTGDVPSSLSRLPRLEILDLSRNLVTGQLPAMKSGSVRFCGETCMCDDNCSPRIAPESPFNPLAFACPAC